MPNLPRPTLRRRSQAERIPLETLPGAARIEVIEAAGLRWVNVERPSPNDQAWLEEEYGFHPLDFEDVFSRNQRPKLDSYDEYLFIVLQFPSFDKSTRRLSRGRGRPVHRAGLPDHPAERAVRPAPGDLRALRDTRGPARARPSRRARATSSTSSSTAASTRRSRCSARSASSSSGLEDDIFEGRSDKIVRDISDAKQEIINFRKIVRPQQTVLADLEKAKQRYLAEELEIYFDDISDAAERIWDILENYKEVVEGLESTNESVLSHRLNDSFRILTAASVVLLPLTLVASIFGMNVKVPG